MKKIKIPMGNDLCSKTKFCV